MVKVFEMSASGGVNIIPVNPTGAPPPVVYRSQGMHIEKSLGALDTALVIDGRRFDDCLEVVTRFRAIEADGAHGTAQDGFVSYSSFYAPGIGMVGDRSGPGTSMDPSPSPLPITAPDNCNPAYWLASHSPRELS